MILTSELIIDFFAGGGGASSGIFDATGRHPDIAINHNQKALAMHRVNHPDTEHLCEDIWKVDPKTAAAGRKIGLAWFSPDCTFYSKARGGKPIREKGKASRALSWVVLRWAAAVRPRVIILENVEEFKDWAPLVDDKPCPRRKGMIFKSWKTQLQNLGYKVEHREERASWYGAPTIRKRLFLIARCDGQPIVWPERTHGEGLLPYRTAAECIDWTIPCPSIFLNRKDGRKIGVNRPLADNTMERIAKGVKKYVLDAAQPFIVNLTHHGSDRNESLGEPLRTVTGAKRGEKALVLPHLQMMSQGGRNEPADEPMRTICTEKGGARAIVVPSLIGVGGRMAQSGERPVDKPYHTTTSKADTVLVAPMLTQYYGKNRKGGERTAPITDPLRTQPTENRHAAVYAFLTRQFGKSVGSPVDAPGPTTTAGGGGKTALSSVFLAQHNTGVVGHDARKPLSTITHRGTQQNIVAANIMKMRGTNIGQDARDPLQTVSAGGTHFAAINARLVPAAEGDFPPSAFLVAAFMLKYYGTDQDPHLDEPLHSATTKDRFAVVMVTISGTDYVIVDIGMRMLSPRELFLCQGFPPSYVIDRGIRVTKNGDTGDLFATDIELTRTEQIRFCGNSVCPPIAAAIVRAQFTPGVREAAA